MAEKKRVRAPVAAVSTPRFLPGLFLLFVGSGCAALIYEVVWFQLLELVIGATAVSLGVLLATFMGGMCAGSLLLPRLVDVNRHPLRVYAVLELGIAAMGLLILVGLPLLGNLYVAIVGYGMPGMLFRGLLCAICLLPPTLLMGATLPAMARWVEATPQGMSWLGFFYGGNIAGAVFGCLAAGFYLLRLHDMATATLVAASLNVAVALAALLLAHSTPHAASRVGRGRRSIARDTCGRRGQCTSQSRSPGSPRLAPRCCGRASCRCSSAARSYTFSIILAAFLAGLGIGSSVGAWLARTNERPGLWLPHARREPWCRWRGRRC